MESLSLPSKETTSHDVEGYLALRNKNRFDLGILAETGLDVKIDFVECKIRNYFRLNERSFSVMIHRFWERAVFSRDKISGGTGRISFTVSKNTIAKAIGCSLEGNRYRASWKNDCDEGHVEKVLTVKADCGKITVDKLVAKARHHHALAIKGYLHNAESKDSVLDFNRFAIFHLMTRFPFNLLNLILQYMYLSMSQTAKQLIVVYWALLSRIMKKQGLHEHMKNRSNESDLNSFILDGAVILHQVFFVKDNLTKMKLNVQEDTGRRRLEGSSASPQKKKASSALMIRKLVPEVTGLSAGVKTKETEEQS